MFWVSRKGSRLPVADASKHSRQGTTKESLWLLIARGARKIFLCLGSRSASQAEWQNAAAFSFAQWPWLYGQHIVGVLWPHPSLITLIVASKLFLAVVPYYITINRFWMRNRREAGYLCRSHFTMHTTCLKKGKKRIWFLSWLRFSSSPQSLFALVCVPSKCPLWWPLRFLVVEIFIVVCHVVRRADLSRFHQLYSFSIQYRRGSVDTVAISANPSSLVWSSWPSLTSPVGESQCTRSFEHKYT